MAKKDDKKLLEEARKRFKTACEADRDNREKAQDDLEFVFEPGEQWDASIKQERGNRPCYEFNKIRTTIARTINAIRANRPQGKVRAVEDNDKDTASTLEGLIRNIWNVSDADSAIDNAAKYQVAGGMGAWRIITEYSADTSWDQDIRIVGLRNPFCLYADPAAKDHQKRDARYWFVTSKIAKEAFTAKYGDKGAIDFEGGEWEDDEEWEDEDSVRICEYWYKKPVTKTLALLSDGSTVDVAEVDENSLVKMDENGQPQKLTVERTREVQAHKICMIVMSGDRILEGPIEWAGSKFPFVMCYGESVVLDGKLSWFGMTRFSKDAQRAYNVARTAAIEAVALAPNSKFWATPAQAVGHTEHWARAHKELLPYQLYNPDPQAQGAPQRMGGADVPAALVQESMLASDDIKGTAGVFDPSLGATTNAVSGTAKRAEISQAEIANFNYQDNISSAIRYTWEILIDLVPKVYDTERSVRILGTDGAEQYAKVNSFDPQGNAVNDLSKGKFDVTVTTGPSFSTQRQEAAEVYMGLAQANPAVFGIAGDLIFKSLDLPYAEDMADRMKTMLPPPIQQMIQQKAQGGKPLPPEAMAAMQQADQAMQMVQQQGQMLQQAAQEVQQGRMELEQQKSEIQRMIGDLKVQQANLKAAEAQLRADVAEAQAEFAQREAALQGQGKDIQHAGEQLQSQAEQVGQATAADMVQQALQVVTERIALLEQALKQAQPVVIPVGGGNRRIAMRKVAGGYEADVLEG